MCFHADKDRKGLGYLGVVGGQREVHSSSHRPWLFSVFLAHVLTFESGVVLAPEAE